MNSKRSQYKGMDGTIMVDGGDTGKDNTKKFISLMHGNAEAKAS